MPSYRYVWPTVLPLPITVSPKSHSYAVISPNGSNEDEASKWTVSPVSASLGETVNEETGLANGRCSSIVIDRALVRPLLSRTVRVTTVVPGLAYVWSTTEAVPARAVPSASVDPEPSKTTGDPAYT